MNSPTRTYFELSLETDLHYWAVVTLRCGHTYYKGPYKSRSTARYWSLKLSEV